MEETIELLGKGKVAGFKEEIPEIISTGSSHVFIFKENNVALKVYRRDNEHWNKNFSDMSEGEARRTFIMMDYEWNHFYSPEIYLGIKQARPTKEGTLELSEDISLGDELIIEMKILKSDTFLMNILSGDVELTIADYFSIGKQMALITQPQTLKPGTDENFYEIMKERVVDLTSWIKSLPTADKSFTSKLEFYLHSYTERSRSRFELLTRKDLVAVIDCHAANAVYEQGKISCIDVLLPKELWRVSRVNDNFFRIGVDIAVLRGQVAYEAYRDGFMSITPFDTSDEMFDLIYCASTMFGVQSTYAEKDESHKPLVDKYYSFVKGGLANI